jgi:hypothetical protein
MPRVSPRAARAYGEMVAEAVRDALINIRHKCDRHGLEFARLDRAAQEIYTLEVLDRRRQRKDGAA